MSRRSGHLEEYGAEDRDEIELGAPIAFPGIYVVLNLSYRVTSARKRERSRGTESTLQTTYSSPPFTSLRAARSVPLGLNQCYFDFTIHSSSAYAGILFFL